MTHLHYPAAITAVQAIAADMKYELGSQEEQWVSDTCEALSVAQNGYYGDTDSAKEFLERTALTSPYYICTEHTDVYKLAERYLGRYLRDIVEAARTVQLGNNIQADDNSPIKRGYDFLITYRALKAREDPRADSFMLRHLRDLAVCACVFYAELHN